MMSPITFAELKELAQARRTFNRRQRRAGEAMRRIHNRKIQKRFQRAQARNLCE